MPSSLSIWTTAHREFYNTHRTERPQVYPRGMAESRRGLMLGRRASMQAE